MASDSRWSIETGDFVLYLDDARFGKIALANDVAFIFAGAGKLIQQWKVWISKGPSGNVGRPATRDNDEVIALCMVAMGTAEVIFRERQQSIFCDDPIKADTRAFFAGSGAAPARCYWCQTQYAMKAVDAAIGQDVYSGGEVRYVRFNTREHNLVESETIDQVADRIIKEGIVMYKNMPSQTGVPVAVAAESDPKVRTTLEEVKGGTKGPRAPFDTMRDPWTPEAERRLDAALNRVFPRS